MKAEEIPKDLHPVQYGAKLLENVGLPAITSNMKVAGDCISSIAKSRKIRPDEAYVWLYQRAKFAQESGEKVNFLWFSNGEYNNTKFGCEPVRSTFERTDWKALEEHRKTPEYQESNQKLLATLAKYGPKKFPEKAAK